MSEQMNDEQKLLVIIAILAPFIIPKDHVMTDGESEILGSNLVKLSRFILTARVPIPESPTTPTTHR